MHTEDAAAKQTILVLNSGSSSLKFGLFAQARDDEALLLEGSAEGIGRGDGSLRISAPDGSVLVQREHVLESQMDALRELSQVVAQQHQAQPAALGHRVVHGGPHLRAHQRITPEVRRRLQDAEHFAPLHIPPALALIDEATKIFGGAAHFACFDTAFHATLPPRAAQLALPRCVRECGAQDDRRLTLARLDDRAIQHTRHAEQARNVFERGGFVLLALQFAVQRDAAARDFHLDCVFGHGGVPREAADCFRRDLRVAQARSGVGHSAGAARWLVLR